MNYSETFKVTTPSDREIAMTRVFNAPRHLVFDALTQPALVTKWLLGPPGWTMPICDIDLRVGGAYRFLWRNEKGKEMGSSGVFREIVPPDGYVATERFDDPWYEGEALITYKLIEQNGITTLILTMLCESTETRNVILRSGMEKGVAMSFDRLAELAGEPRTSEC